MKQSLDFIARLAEHNNREWFAEYRADYETALSGVIAFADELLLEVGKHDVLETNSGKKSLHRIYRDVRFSKEKIPYKNNWSGRIKRATAQRRGSYYFHLRPGNKSFIAGGFWGPEKEDLKLIREHLSQESEAYREIINAPDFLAYFGEVKGDQLKSAPKGFAKDHEAIDLLRHKQFVLMHGFTDKEVLSKDFSQIASGVYSEMRPYLDIMTDFLTTNLNGIEIELT